MFSAVHRIVRRLARTVTLSSGCTWVGLAVVANCATAAPVVSAPRPFPALASAPTKLESALDSVSADNIRADVYFIASDEMGGRDTPSVGQKIAARYIRSRLERLGWQPGAKNGYFFTYKVHVRSLDTVASHVTWEIEGKPVSLRFGQDYVLNSKSDIDDVQTSAGVVFCGSGSQADFDAAKPRGRWALCFDSGTEIRKLGKIAKSSGAAGLIVAPGPDGSRAAWSERFAEETEHQREPSVSYASSRERAREVFPQMRWTRDAVERMLADARVHAPAAPLALGTEIALTVTETRKLPSDGGLIDLEDVCGFWPGSDPELAQEVLIVSAHYDHVGTKNGVVYNGADDNGSGTCGLMALAEALTHYGPMRRSVMLIWVSGEEKGLWGSQAWTEHPWLPEGCRAVCDINIDMIGRNAPDKLLITPSRNHDKYNGLTRLAESVGTLEGFPRLGSADEYYKRSDHYNFAKMGIPAAFLFSDIHADYHKPTDTPEKIDNDKIRRVVRMVLRMLEGLQGDRLNL